VSTSRESVPRTIEEIADADDLRSVIQKALAARPVDDTMLRRGVWTYVGLERAAGTSPGPVIVVLNDLIDAAGLTPLDARRELTRRVILWCVEAYFGHLGGNAVGGEQLAATEVANNREPTR
jgi:hypothetical protein